MTQYFEVKIKVTNEIENKKGEVKTITTNEKFLVLANDINDVPTIVNKQAKAIFDDFEIISYRKYDIVDILKSDDAN